MDDWDNFVLPDRKNYTDEEFHQYFVDKYGANDADFFRKRFAAAMAYKRNHVDPLPAGEMRVLLFGPKLRPALYRLYSRCPDESLDEPYALELVARLASEHRRNY